MTRAARATGFKVLGVQIIFDSKQYIEVKARINEDGRLITNIRNCWNVERYQSVRGSDCWTKSPDLLFSGVVDPGTWIWFFERNYENTNKV